MRRRNWLALAVGNIVVLFSYFTYLGAFSFSDEHIAVDPGLVGIGATIAPLAFIVFGFLSRNPRAARDVLRAMGALLALGLGLGLITPAIGATAGFGAGAAICLNRPQVEGVYKRRAIAVVFAVVYTFVLLVIDEGAGVFTGAILPVLMVGFADEYSAWVARRHGAAAG